MILPIMKPHYVKIILRSLYNYVYQMMYIKRREKINCLSEMLVDETGEAACGRSEYTLTNHRVVRVITNYR